MMASRRESYSCSECGYEAYKWMGRCPDCGSWSTIAEKKTHRPARKPGLGISVSSLRDHQITENERSSTGISEFDRVLGGGAVKGSVLLLGGDPGIGKSTLILQAAGRMNKSGKVLYVSGEESLTQIKIRANRLQVDESFFAVAESEFGVVLDTIETVKPDILIIDSIQAMYNREVEGIPGSISQVKDITTGLIHQAKKDNITVFLIGHVTKEGSIAGPRLLEHMVDGVFYLEGERYHSFRVLRGVKNRFGSTNEIGIFLMNERGLEEVEDPSYLFISAKEKPANGSTITASLSGSRPFLVEIQSLVTVSGYATPRRTSTGVDHNRVALIIAVLEKHLGISFYGMDTFVNAVGGVKLMEPSVDLAIAVSLVSGIRERGISQKTVIIGEVGLTGEVRSVSRIVPRVLESEKLGFKKCFMPRQNSEELKKERNYSIEIIPTDNIKDAIEKAFD